MTTILFSLLAVASAAAGFITHKKVWRIPIATFVILATISLFDIPAFFGWGVFLLGVLALLVTVQKHRGKGTRLLSFGCFVVIAAMVTYGLVIVVHTVKGEAGTPSKDTIAALTVTQAESKCGTKKLEIGALKPLGKNDRQRPDAITTKFTVTNNSTAMLKEVKLAVCTDPLYGVQILNFFANLKMGSFRFVDANPWLKGFQGTEPTTINSAASMYMEPGKGDEWRGMAGKINTLLGQFSFNTERSGKPILSYHLLGTGSSVGNIPPVGLDDKLETRPALLLVLVPEGTTQCKMQIGFNVYDKGLAQYACPSN